MSDICLYYAAHLQLYQSNLSIIYHPFLEYHRILHYANLIIHHLDDQLFHLSF